VALRLVDRLDGDLPDQLHLLYLSDPSLRDVLHFQLYCRPELVPFYERWEFTADLGELRFMRRGASRPPP